MTDRDIDDAIAGALDQPGNLGKAALLALRDRLRQERELIDPKLGDVWNAVVEVAARLPDDLAELLALSEDRARWLAAARGPGHADTIDAWSELAAAADIECEWDIASRAWDAVASAPVDLEHGDPAALASVSLALRGLGARSLAGRQLDDARQLFERDLAIRERLHPQADPQLAVSLDNLASVLERLGDRARSLAVRQRERDVLVATGASSGQIRTVERHIAQLNAP